MVSGAGTRTQRPTFAVYQLNAYNAISNGKDNARDPISGQRGHHVDNDKVISELNRLLLQFFHAFFRLCNSTGTHQHGVEVAMRVMHAVTNDGAAIHGYWLDISSRKLNKYASDAIIYFGC